MTFREATDRLTTGTTYTLAQLARVFGKSTQSIQRARMTGEHARTPPPDWERTVARVAREHAQTLRVEAGRLEQLADELDRAA